MSIKEKILATRSQLKRERVSVSEWGVDVEVRELNTKERILLHNKNTKAPEKHIAHWIIAAVYETDTGKPIFSEGDADAVMELAYGPLSDVFSKVLELAGVDTKAEETAEKN